MKLIETIGYLKTIGNTEKLIASEGLSIELGLIDVYLKDKLDIESEVRFFDVDTIPNNLEIDIEGIHYVNLFPLVMMQEIIQDYSNLTTPKPSNTEIAKRLLEYRIKDA